MNTRLKILIKELLCKHNYPQEETIHWHSKCNGSLHYYRPNQMCTKCSKLKLSGFKGELKTIEQTFKDIDNLYDRIFG